MMMIMIIIQIVGFKEEDKLQVPRSYAFIGTAKDSDNLSDCKRRCQSITLAHGFHPSSKQEQTPGLKSCTVIRRTQCFVTAVRDTAPTEKHRCSSQSSVRRIITNLSLQEPTIRLLLNHITLLLYKWKVLALPVTMLISRSRSSKPPNRRRSAGLWTFAFKVSPFEAWSCFTSASLLSFTK
jgi:hypothetical protein